MSAKSRIKELFRARVGEIVSANEISAAANIHEWARRVRELRDEEGWPIRSHNDDSSLRPDQYRLEYLPTIDKGVRFRRGISQRLRAEVLDRNGFTCQMCGATPGEIDEYTGRKVRLHIGHIVDKSLGGKDELSNLRSLCASCNQGAKNITQERPSAAWLLGQVRRAGRSEQLAVLEWLKKKFAGE